MLTSDNKLYRYSGTSWTKAISAADLDDQVNLATQVFGQVQASSLTAGQISTASIQAGAVVADSISSGAISAVKLAADSVTSNAIAANSVSASEVVAGSLTSTELNTSQIFADSAVIGAIQSSSITTAAVVSAIGTFEFIQSSNIQSNAITGGKIAASTIDANKLNVSNLAAISANLGAVTAGSINASQVSISNINGSNIASGTVPTARLDVSGIISAGAIVVNGANISDLTNNSAFITGGQVNTNVTAISGGVITTGTINASRINIDNVTLDTNGSGQLIIHASGVNSAQIAANALGTIKGDRTSDQTAQQFSTSYTSFIASTPFHQFGGQTLQLLADITFTTPLSTSDLIDYLITLQGNPSGTFSSSSVTMITTHIQRTASLGQSYDEDGTRSGDFNTYGFSFSTGITAGGILMRPVVPSLRGGSTIYVKLYGYQKNVTSTPQWDNNFVTAEALAR